MTIPSRNMNDLDVPEFTEEHRQFFRELIALTQQDRLALDLNNPQFKLQWVSLEAIERELKWLIDIGKARMIAETLERVEGVPYDPQAVLESGYLHDLEEDLEGIDDLQTLNQML